MKKSFALVILSGLLTLALSLPAAAALSVGDPAPDFTLKTLDGEETVKLSDLKGQVVYIDFWASWCAPCRRAFPAVMSLHEEYEEQGFTVVAVSIDRKVDAAVKFMSQQKTDVPSVFDEGGLVARAYGVRSIPNGILVGPDGKVVKNTVGFNPKELPVLKSTIEKLLADVEPPEKAEKKEASRLEAEADKS